MQQLGFRSVFIKLFVSVMLALTLFAIAMVFLTQLVHDNSNTTRSQIIASQILTQVDPFLKELESAAEEDNHLQARFMLAVVKKSFDIFDESLQARMGLYNRNGRLLVQTENSDLPKKLPDEPSWLMRVIPFAAEPPSLHMVQVYSSTGYTLLYESRLPPKKSTIAAVLNLFTGTLLLLCIMAGVLWWIARSMTWRINEMSQQMLQLGEGNFSVRVDDKGNDEIATLARGFNQSAEKIEQLINANNLLLAHASHELRTPITRIRLQVEMMDMLAGQLPDDSKTKFDKRAQAINRDLTGLNDLVESILLVSRLDAGHALQQVERMDLYDLVHQESQHYTEATLFGEHIVLDAQPKLLTHLIRNLLNNAMIHGTPPVSIFLYGVQNKADADLIPNALAHAYMMQQGDTDTPITSTPPSAEQTNNIAGMDVARDASSNTRATHKTYTPVADSVDTSSSNRYAPVGNVAPEVVETLLPKSERQAETDKPANGNPESKKLESKNEKTDGDMDARRKSDSLFKKRSKKSKSDEAQLPKFAVLAVVDEGSGIPVEKRQDVFSPFVRLKQEKKGSGLGLSLVAQIVEAHQGEIKTDTWEGRTRFLVVIPLAPLGQSKAMTTAAEQNNKTK